MLMALIHLSIPSAPHRCSMLSFGNPNRERDLAQILTVAHAIRGAALHVVPRRGHRPLRDDGQIADQTQREHVDYEVAFFRWLRYGDGCILVFVGVIGVLTGRVSRSAAAATTLEQARLWAARGAQSLTAVISWSMAWRQEETSIELDQIGVSRDMKRESLSHNLPSKLLKNL